MARTAHRFLRAATLVLLISATALLMVSCTISEQPPPAQALQIKLIKSEMKELGDADILSLDVLGISQPLDCEAILQWVDEETKGNMTLPLGPIDVNQSRYFEFLVSLPPGKIHYTISTICAPASTSDASSPDSQSPDLGSFPEPCREKTGDDQLLCAAFLGKNVSYCRRMTVNERFKCMAIASRDPHFCADYEDLGLRDLCYLDLAVNSRDFTLCNILTDPDFNKACRSVKDDNVTACAAVIDDKAAGLCLASFIYHGKTDKACQKIENPSRRQLCLAIADN